MIRNEKEYRHSKEQLSELATELQKLSEGRHLAERDEVASAVIDALRMQIEDLEREISEYEDLKEGRLLSFGAENLDSLGELLIKAHSMRPHPGGPRRALGHNPTAGSALRARRVAEDQPLASGGGR